MAPFRPRFQPSPSRPCNLCNHPALWWGLGRKVSTSFRVRWQPQHASTFEREREDCRWHDGPALQINAEIFVSRESTCSRPQPHLVHPPLHLPPLRTLDMTDPASPNSGTPTRTSKKPSSSAVPEGRRAFTVPEGAFRRPDRKSVV